MKQTLHDIKPLFLVVVFLLSFNFGWGQTTVTYSFSASGAVSGLGEDSPGISLDSNIGFGSFKNSGTADPTISGGQLRLYQNAIKGGSIKIYALNGVTITKVVVIATTSDAGAGPAGYSVDNTTELGTFTGGGIMTMNVNASSFVEFYNNGNSTTTRTYVKSFEVTYINSNIPSITPSAALTEQNLNGATLTLALSVATFTDAVLNPSNFTLNNAPSGVSIAGVSYVDSETATITLAYDGTDFDTNISNLSVSVAAAELNPSEALTSTSIPITALVENLTVSNMSANFGNQCINTSATQTFTLSGTNLKSGNITVASLSGFTYSLNNSTFNTTLSIPTTGGALAATTIYVKFIPTAVQIYNGNIVISGVGASSVNRSVTGSGVNSPPSVTTQSSSSITTTTATLGGNITAVGCSTTITTRGIEYSTTNGFANGAGTIVSESGTFTTGTFTINVSSLTSNTTYYFKAFATSASGTTYTSQGTFTTLKGEPTNHPTDFRPTGVTSSIIVQNWTASVAGLQAPDGYLVKAANASIVDPVDGVDPADVTNIGGNGTANRKVTTGSATTSATFTGMSSGTMYYYKIYPYTNSGNNIDYKITGAPSFNHATLPTTPSFFSASGLIANGLQFHGHKVRTMRVLKL